MMCDRCMLLFLHPSFPSLDMSQRAVAKLDLKYKSVKKSVI